MKILITGVAGFIGYSLAKKLLNKKKTYNIYGCDSLNNYYSLSLKKNRLKELITYKNFKFLKLNLKNNKKTNNFFYQNKFDIVIHLAAQAGVRYSVLNPKSYLDNNIISFFNVLDLSRKIKVKHFIFASTSSVYGNQFNFPTNENNNTDRPLSFYAATKKSNEVLAYSYANIFKLPSTGLRFFTVYGPYGRPDMALFKFTKNIQKNKSINLFNSGKHDRDFTYIEDVCEYIIKILKKPPNHKIPFEVFNLGNGKSRKLKDYLFNLEKALGKRSIKKNVKIQQGDILKTHADIKKITNKTNYKPKTKIEEGVKKFVHWYKSYYK